MRYTILILPIFITFGTSAQKPANISYDYANKKIVFPAILPKLTKEDRYTVQLPGNLTYHSKSYVEQAWTNMFPVLPLFARLHTVKFGYKFEIVATGMFGLQPQPARYIRTELLDTNKIPREVKGFVRDFTCHFPCTLLIRDADTTVLHRIELAGRDDVFTFTLHRNFLRGDNPSGYSLPESPYPTESDLNDIETVYSDLLAKKIESILIGRFLYQAVTALSYLYKDNNIGKEIFGWGFVKTKNRQYDYADLDKGVLEYRAALDSMEDGNFAGSKAICEKLRATYTGLLQSGDARIDKNVKEILYYNLSHTSFLSGHYREAWDYYRLFIQSGVEEGTRLAGELRNRIQLFEFYDKVRSAVSK